MDPVRSATSRTLAGIGSGGHSDTGDLADPRPGKVVLWLQQRSDTNVTVCAWPHLRAVAPQQDDSASVSQQFRMMSNLSSWQGDAIDVSKMYGRGRKALPDCRRRLDRAAGGALPVRSRTGCAIRCMRRLQGGLRAPLAHPSSGTQNWYTLKWWYNAGMRIWWLPVRRLVAPRRARAVAQPGCSMCSCAPGERAQLLRRGRRPRGRIAGARDVASLQDCSGTGCGKAALVDYGRRGCVSGGACCRHGLGRDARSSLGQRRQAAWQRGPARATAGTARVEAAGGTRGSNGGGRRGCDLPTAGVLYALMRDRLT